MGKKIDDVFPKNCGSPRWSLVLLTVLRFFKKSETSTAYSLIGVGGGWRAPCKGRRWSRTSWACWRSPRWTTSRKLGRTGWRRCRWDRGSWTVGRSANTSATPSKKIVVICWTVKASKGRFIYWVSGGIFRVGLGEFQACRGRCGVSTCAGAGNWDVLMGDWKIVFV